MKKYCNSSLNFCNVTESLKVETSDMYLGTILGDLSKRRASISNITQKDTMKTIEAQVPLKEMIGYASVLRSISQGTANFTMEFLEYGTVDKKEKQQILKFK